VNSLYEPWGAQGPRITASAAAAATIKVVEAARRAANFKTSIDRL